MNSSDGEVTSAAAVAAFNASTISINALACQDLKFQGYIAWENPDNIIKQEVEVITQRVKAGLVLPLVFLLGGPANVINMAVFYRQGLRERINLCLFALSLADELYLLHCMMLNGEEIHRQFYDLTRPGPMFTFYTNWNLTGFYGFCWVSFFISALIACERCFCVVSPLRSQTVLTTRTMAVVLVLVFVVVTGGYFVVGTRYRVCYVQDPADGQLSLRFQGSEFYYRHKILVDHIDSVVYGVALPLMATLLVTTTTAVTGFKLRQAAAWRCKSSTSTSFLSLRQVALTKMLIGSSILFIVCTTPICLLKISLLIDPEMNLGRRHQNLYMFLLWLWEMVSYLNCSGNIVIYYVMGARYRDTLRTMLQSPFRRLVQRLGGPVGKAASSESVRDVMGDSCSGPV